MRISSISKTDVRGAGLDCTKWFDDNGFKWREGVSQDAQNLNRSDSDTPRGANRAALIQQLNLMDPTFNRSQVN